VAGFYLSKISKDRLKGVHPDLVRVVERAIRITKVDFRVQQGLRTIEEQRRLKAAGASQTLRSRHLTGHAVDLVALIGRDVRWDWPLYHQIAEAMKKAANELGVSIEWGGDWKSFKDGPHFQLPWAVYP
jgi:peptidoglycan L-alanyl-D-glutamate endopeptidase CwlK